MNVTIQNYLSELLSEKLETKVVSLEFQRIGGGSINNTYRLIINKHFSFFLKLNSAYRFPALFKKEKDGLEFLKKQKIIRTPDVLACSIVEDHQILLLEWIEGGLKTELFWEKFGEELATLHKQTWIVGNDSCFGFIEDNYMGALIQLNEQRNKWADFFIHCRLQPQIKLARDNSLLEKKNMVAFENLFPKLDSIFDEEKSSLLHGDLWSGNFMCNKNSQPVLIDPAIYFGHRCMDLAMTALFGGFDKLFYESYNHYFSFPDNYHEQWEICNLYPLLIHLNLFGKGYLSQIESVLRKFN